MTRFDPNREAQKDDGSHLELILKVLDDYQIDKILTGLQQIEKDETLRYLLLKNK